MRKRGKYWQITVNGARKSAKTASREDAAKLQEKLRSEAYQRKHFGIRFSKWEEACLSWMQKKKALKSVRTQTYWESYWTGHLKGKSIISITGEMIRDILLERDGVDPDAPTRQNNTANQYAAFVAKIMKHARAPFEFETLPETRGRDEWLTVDQWRTLEPALSDELRQIVTFSLATGLRKANVIGLSWEWIKGNSLIIPAEFTKTGKPYGLPLNKTALRIIQERRQGPVIHASRVFTMAGQEIGTVPLHRAWKRALKASGVPDMPYHGLRHTYASWMVQTEVPYEIVAKLCQWSLKGMIHKYAHFDVEKLRPWAERFDTIIAQKSDDTANHLQLHGNLTA